MKRTLIKKILIRLTGSQLAQRWLEFFMKTDQYLMGIGSGYEVADSGERAFLKAFQKLVSPPYVIFDVGSNKGQFLGAVTEQLSPSAYSIHCFEPARATFKALQAAAGQNPNIRMNNVGISDQEGESILWYEKELSIRASLTKRSMEHKNYHYDLSEVVKTTTIDQYCRENQIDHIHLLKLDIEGYEFQALKGAAKTLESAQIDMVAFEFGAANIDTRKFFKDFWQLFSQAGMNLYRLTPSGLLVHIQKYNEFYEQFLTTNYVAVSPKYPIR